MKNIPVAIVVTFLIFQSCNTKKTEDWEYFTFSNSNFETTENLHYNKLKHIELQNPKNIYVVDSLLITVDQKTEFLVQVYSIKTGKILNKLIRRGKGPYELLNLDYLQKQNDTKKLLAFGTQLKKVIEFPFCDLTKNLSEIEFKEFFINDRGCIRLIEYDNNYIGFTLHDSLINRFFIYNNEGNLVNTTGVYPKIVPYVGNMMDAHLFSAYAEKLTNNNIVLAYQNMDLIEIYSPDLKIQKRLLGPNGYLPDYELFIEGTLRTIRFKEEQRTSFGDIIIDTDKNEFWITYSGRKFSNKAYLKSTVYHFSSDGTCLNKYTLDFPIFKMDINFETKTIYALTNNPEYEIYKITY